MEKYQIGDVVTGYVTGIEDYGIFLSFGDNCSGLIHISEISDSFVKKVSDYAEINSKMDAVILGFDSDNHYKLSLKAINHDGNVKKTMNGIAETSLGFESLSNSLDCWIRETIDKIDKNKKN